MCNDLTSGVVAKSKKWSSVLTLTRLTQLLEVELAWHAATGLEDRLKYGDICSTLCASDRFLFSLKVESSARHLEDGLICTI